MGVSSINQIMSYFAILLIFFLIISPTALEKDTDMSAESASWEWHALCLDEAVKEGQQAA